MSLFTKLGCLSLTSILIRLCISLNTYSGFKTPPMFGDYEAQRHWQEITVNLQPSDWYRNTTQNDLLYWGLDYPPLTAYHSLVCGFVAKLINPDWVSLNSSRGYESYEHKLFMRYSVVIGDILVFIPAVLYYALAQRPNQQILPALALLLSPGLILIDHGHFQYNGVSLGFALLAVAFIDNGIDLLGSVMFCLALNYKQMELYHAIPFFCYLLGSCFQMSFFKGYLKLMMLGLVVLITMGICWLPFLQDLDSMLVVLKRLFPFARGLYEDKVANVWCSLSIVIKLKQLITQEKLVLLCLATTFGSLIPTSLHLLFKPTVQNFKMALVNSSLAFFLFSFQVHEKSILLAVLPINLLAANFPLTSLWFTIIATFSMLPLLVKDGILIPAVALTTLYTIIMIYNLPTSTKKEQNGDTNFFSNVLMTLSVLGAVALSVASVLVSPPSRLPDLFPVLISSYSCVHFLMFFIYFNYYQLTQSGYGLYINVVKSKKKNLKKTN